ncbi:MAG: 50S ribosomal protein L10 [Victivallales bacterium]|nr:50S ribosomal protein L10 [Victivallales bacterium]
MRKKELRAEKIQIGGVIESLLKDRPAILISYQGLTANVSNEFRGKLAAINAECHVVKNTLVKKAAAKLGLKDLENAALDHDTALISGNCDAVALAKALRDFAKGKEQIKVKYGILDGVLLSPADVDALADLPSREVLLAQLLGLLQAPGSQLVRVLNAKIASVVYVLDAIRKKKEEAVA